jgi:hypothetical protein
MTPGPDLQGAARNLFALQLAIARKADQLARERCAPAGLNLHCWLLAEAEVLGGSGIDTLAAASSGRSRATLFHI